MKTYFITQCHDADGEPGFMTIDGQERYDAFKNEDDSVSEWLNKWSRRSTWVEVDEATYQAYKGFVKANSEEFGYFIAPAAREQHIKALALQMADEEEAA